MSPQMHDSRGGQRNKGREPGNNYQSFPEEVPEKSGRIVLSSGVQSTNNGESCKKQCESKALSIMVWEDV